MNAEPESVKNPERGAETRSAAGGMTHRQVMEALSGLLLGMFVAILSSTVVSNALPRIVSDLKGTESSYTWVVTATLLATTASTPIWGKLADLASKKLLVQLSLIVYIAGSALAGLSQNIGELIACRVLQGVGAGGLTALAQVVMAAMIAPRERGKYSGYLGAVLALGTIGGPLIGGVIVDTSWLGWRWCFYVGVPFAVAAILVLQKTLRLPLVRRAVKIDYLGATLLTASVSLILIWVTLAGGSYAWWSWQTVVMVLGSILLGVLALFVERRAAEPIVPLRLFRSRTVGLATVASVFVGLAMFGATVFLSQYFQLSRGKSPTVSGLMTLPMILGLLLASTVVGRLITRYGKWKRYLVAGGVLLTIGLALMGTIRVDTSFGLIACYMFLIGVGVGMTMQNLVLAVQNTIDPRDLGAGSSVISFFRSLGGAMGVSALGALLSTKITTYLTSGLAAIGVHSTGSSGSGIPDLATLPAPVRAVVEAAYGHAVGNVFLVAAPFALLGLIAVLFIREVPLRQQSGTQLAAAADRASAKAGADATAVETIPARG